MDISKNILKKYVAFTKSLNVKYVRFCNNYTSVTIRKDFCCVVAATTVFVTVCLAHSWEQKIADEQSEVQCDS